MPDRGRDQLLGAVAGEDVDVADRPTGIGADLVDPGLQRLLDGRRLVGGDRDLMEQPHQRVLALERLLALLLIFDLGEHPEPLDDPPLAVAHAAGPGPETSDTRRRRPA